MGTRKHLHALSGGILPPLSGDGEHLFVPNARHVVCLCCFRPRDSQGESHANGLSWLHFWSNNQCTGLVFDFTPRPLILETNGVSLNLQKVRPLARTHPVENRLLYLLGAPREEHRFSFVCARSLPVESNSWVCPKKWDPSTRGFACVSLYHPEKGT